ncbi:GNAT family N-acetyltransferase [Streptomyces sp. NPDC005840]|uniref:GNAT family N-acetyltransferase n=1 Tax=Streptomyces sp. NPDC005840 TaxID=3157072 RepID=UPI0033C835AB
MTDPVIRPLDASTVDLFDTLPDPLDCRTTHLRTRYRPDWKRVALRDGRVVARAAWWGGPDDTEPSQINWFDVAEGEEAAGAALLRGSPWRVGLELTVPSGWRDDPAGRAAVDARCAAARLAGHEPLVERFTYRWTPDRGLPERPTRLVFRAEPDDAVFLDALRRIHSVTLDAHALKAVREGGPDRAAREELDFFRWCPSPRAWWQVAYTRQGEPVGIHVPVHNPSGPAIGFIGVLPEHRGRGYGRDLLAECTHFLVERGAEFVAAATDQGNVPMAGHFAWAGYPVVRERIHFSPLPAA